MFPRQTKRRTLKFGDLICLHRVVWGPFKRHGGRQTMDSWSRRDLEFGMSAREILRNLSKFYDELFCKGLDGSIYYGKSSLLLRRNLMSNELVALLDEHSLSRSWTNQLHHKLWSMMTRALSMVQWHGKLTESVNLFLRLRLTSFVLI